MAKNKTPIKRKRTDGVLSGFSKLTKNTQEYFKDIPRLLEDKYDSYIVLSALFSLIEKGQNEALYLGITKRHRTMITLTRERVSRQHMTRKGFKVFFNAVFNADIPEDIVNLMNGPENMRDSILHGKKCKKSDILGAIWSALQYADEMNKFLWDKFKIKPYGSNKGGRGQVKPLTHPTTVLILDGIFSRDTKKESI